MPLAMAVLRWPEFPSCTDIHHLYYVSHSDGGMDVLEI